MINRFDFEHLAQYDYDAASNRTQLKLNGSVHTSYAYDDANRLTTLTDEASQNFAFGYDIADRMTSRTMPNGITSTFEYDGMSRLKRLKHQSTSATLVDNQYSYNAASQISQIAELTQIKNFTYDNVDRLTGMTNGTSTESYTYDDIGNRTASHLSASYGYQSGKFNQLASTAMASYQFDANGNTIRKSEGQNFWRYTWDYENRLTEASTRKEKARYKYDALGRRVERNLRFSKERTRFTHDGLDVVMDDAETGITKYQNGLGTDDKLKLTNSGNASYFLGDHLGSTLGLSNSTASVTTSAGYDSFGNATGNLASRYQFTGREFDTFSGLQFSRARFYDPKLGRFSSEDPIGFGGGDINLYGYVHSNAMNKRDPLGLIDPSVYQDPKIYDQGKEAACELGDSNVWTGLEAGGNVHLLYAGAGASAGFDVNPLTGEVCLYTKVSGRVGFGAFAGAGAKFNAGFGPYSQGSGTNDFAEFAADAAVKGGGKVTLKGGKFVSSLPWNFNKSGSANTQGGGFGFGPNVGYGISVGADVGKKFLWCFNTPPKSACKCKQL
ncbi:MAG: RHS repeat-associated core domain-containing protein [Acidobacteria bacterium]|nr:RHS repeat-associated core domain-containing protein [Acidobacteriota bacterium]